MCFYVNLRELWPFASIFSRHSNRRNEKPSPGRSGSKRNNNCIRKKANSHEKTDIVNGQFCCRWNENELEPYWLTSASVNKQTLNIDAELGQHDVIPASAGNQIADNDNTNIKAHYGNNLLASLSNDGGVLSLDAGDGGGLFAKEENNNKTATTTTTDNRLSANSVHRTLLDDELPIIEPTTGRTTITRTPTTTTLEIMSAQKQVSPVSAADNTSQEGNRSETQKSAIYETQKYQREQLKYIDQLPEPSQHALAEASKFRVRTAQRRHLDFDEEYDLDDLDAPQRSRWSGSFHFIQAADCQFGMIDSYVHHRTEPGWREEIELCERLVGLCHQMQPKPLFMIICGDLVDSLPTSDVGRRQVVDFKRIFAKLDPTIPLVCVCGNHDVGDEPTTKTINDYRQTFGDDYFYFTKNDILFIVINSQFYQNRDQVQNEAREQDQWLENLLTKCKFFKYSIIFEHIPWFLKEANEDNDYFNIRKEVRLEWLGKFREAGVTKIMCGHYHRNAGGWFEDMELVVTSAIGAQCGNDKSGIRIVRVLDNSIEHQYYAMEDVPLKIELN